MNTRLILCLFVAILLFSCNNNSENEGTKIDAADVPAVNVGDSLPADYKERPVFAPITGVKVITNPEDSIAPAIVANRLSIFFEDDETDMNAFVKDFKKLYPKDEYKIISFNDLLKTIEIQVPEDVLDVIHKGLETQMPDYKFIITVETIYSQEESDADKCADAGWHIDAINLRKAWETTKGSKKVVVAVVDDGFDVNHELFKGRVISPYNIFTNDGNVYYNSTNGMHGTHVAGIAVGASTHIDKGVTGVAPECLLMPVQVFDGERTTTFALATGILYAVAEGADVINMSAGPSYAGCGDVPLDFQREFSKRCQKDEERLWKMVLAKAKKKNCIVVFSAGNDHVLSCLPPQNRTGDAIVVCASEKGNKATPFTNYADASTVSAPGLDIYSSVPGNKYSCLDGTSMAAPVVSGLVALMKTEIPDVTISEIVSILQKTGIAQSGDIPVMVQADKALEYLTNPTSGMLNGHEWVDLGLPSGTLWASSNIGASTPECYGDYFAWGETKIKYIYNPNTYKYADNPTILPKSADATASWGTGWRMPTKTDFEELKNKCEWIWNNIGYNVVGTNGNSIFIPATGCQTEGDNFLAGLYGFYWSSSIYHDNWDHAYMLHFYSGAIGVSHGERCIGFSVRPVCNKKK
ncbi:MAG: S8 family serine peptidase [Bacteroidales bacterium]|nr:S8 family serine peptidase [Bacteroidales bacterium]